ncbi:probable oxidoreductase PXDNL isoform X2 [Manis pentadactyla]|uniref:probable oxidoreductase PXDNL isoform X2 n=1 Tax=Manis pentadactyla TaxID=143292 RepID=UPI00255D1598|nr:probable oxidoreductase PXDNL isoform X2 [Manis pentadactyla]
MPCWLQSPSPEQLRPSHSLDLGDNIRLHLFDGGTLVIENMHESDQGAYQCVVRNSSGEEKTRKARPRYSTPPGGSRT